MNVQFGVHPLGCRQQFEERPADTLKGGHRTFIGLMVLIWTFDSPNNVVFTIGESIGSSLRSKNQFYVHSWLVGPLLLAFSKKKIFSSYVREVYKNGLNIYYFFYNVINGIF